VFLEKREVFVEVIQGLANIDGGVKKKKEKEGCK